MKKIEEKYGHFSLGLIYLNWKIMQQLQVNKATDFSYKLILHYHQMNKILLVIDRVHSLISWRKILIVLYMD